ncbi:MAG: ABC transporter ATP-binding protein [Candidatus Latescibacterota bacterium]
MHALVEPVDARSAARLEAAIPRGEEVLIRTSSDLGPDGRFGRWWVVVTAARLLVLPEAGDDGLLEVPVAQIDRAHTEPLVGGGRLEVERRGAATVLVPYTQTRASRFSRVARGLEQLRRGEPFTADGEPDRLRCPRCDRLLPERNGLCPACVHKLATLRRIAAYMAPYPRHAVVLALSSAAITAAELVPPLVTRRLVDDVLDPASGTAGTLETRIRLLGLLVLVLVGARLLSWVADFTHGWVMTWLGARVTADIRSRLFHRLEMLSLHFYDRRQVGSLMSRVTRDAGRLQEFLVEGLPYLVINGLMMAGILCFLFYLSWELALLVLLPVPLMVAWGTVFWRRLRRFFTRWGEEWSRLTERTNESLNGIRVVKAFAQERREMASFARANRQVREVAVTTALNRGVFFATMTFLTGLGVLIVWLAGGAQVLAGRLTLGTLLAFYSYLWLFYGPLEWVAQVNAWMTQCFAGAERIFEVIDAPPEAYDSPTALPLPRLEGGIEFDGVSFGYDKSKPVLRDLNLRIAPGEMIGLVGRSGVGKTTAVNLVARFYEADQGAIRMDGIEIGQIRLRDLRRQIGIVSQEPVLFSGTVAENIGYGKPGASLPEIMQAARVANAHGFIVARPDGYDTQVGERGASLSGGERQRVAIARAILHDPRILILDEATSSVDVQTEKQIQDAVGRLTQGRTTLAIAHRLSTLRHADRLVVLEDGAIVESGTHAELLGKRGRFWELVQLQQQVAQVIAIAE